VVRPSSGPLLALPLGLVVLLAGRRRQRRSLLLEPLRRVPRAIVQSAMSRLSQRLPGKNDCLSKALIGVAVRFAPMRADRDRKR
jgi:hypothetical protein